MVQTGVFQMMRAWVFRRKDRRKLTYLGAFLVNAGYDSVGAYKLVGEAYPELTQRAKDEGATELVELAEVENWNGIPLIDPDMFLPLPD
jgi:hypothetical protein